MTGKRSDELDLAQESHTLAKRVQHCQDRLAEALRDLNQFKSKHGINNKGIGEIHDAFDASKLPAHALLQLTDSALPLGSFAFSSGLESYIAHSVKGSNGSGVALLWHFLRLSLASLASTALPFLLAVAREPTCMMELDDIYDATIMCPVARRASVSQGKGMLNLWTRSLRHGTDGKFEGFISGPDGSGQTVDHVGPAAIGKAHLVLKQCDLASKPARRCKGMQAGDPANDTMIKDDGVLLANTHHHMPLLYALVCVALGITLHEAAYTFLFNHAKAVASAAVRAGVLGPYASHAVLISAEMEKLVTDLMRQHWDTPVEEAGQKVPLLDVLMGRHELLYSRIFNT